jgi:hypothetical protein
MPFYLSLAADVDNDELQELTELLCSDLRNEAELDVELVKAEAASGEKPANVPLYGQIILTAIGSGGVAVAFVNVLKAWIQKKSSLAIKLKDAEGKTLEFKAENMRGKDVKEIAQSIQEAFKQAQP